MLRNHANKIGAPITNVNLQHYILSFLSLKEGTDENAFKGRGPTPSRTAVFSDMNLRTYCRQFATCLAQFMSYIWTLFSRWSWTWRGKLRPKMAWVPVQKVQPASSLFTAHQPLSGSPTRQDKNRLQQIVRSADQWLNEFWALKTHYTSLSWHHSLLILEIDHMTDVLTITAALIMVHLNGPSLSH